MLKSFFVKIYLFHFKAVFVLLVPLVSCLPLKVCVLLETDKFQNPYLHSLYALYTSVRTVL